MKLLDILLETYKEEYELNIQEGLIKTTNIGKTLNLLQKAFPDFYIRKMKSNTFAIDAKELNQDTLNKILQYADNLGWFPSWVASSKYVGKYIPHKFIPGSITFEAKFDEEVVENIPSILYHLTPTQNVENILKIGLVPKSRSKASYHPERVYLGKSIESVESLAPQMYQRTGNKNFTILKIDTDMIPGGYLKLYTDPNFSEEAYYTLNNIPPHTIKKVKEINI
jgi:hypothetical protein